MTPLEAANRLIEIKTTADVHSDSIQWSSEDVAYFNTLCIDHATGIAEALIAAMAENERVCRDIEDVAAAHHTEVELTTLHRQRADELREMNDRLTEELSAIDRISGAFGDPALKGEYLSRGLIARRVQDCAVGWQRANDHVMAISVLEQANHSIGRWFSAAVDDPGTCAEMRVDLEAWFKAWGVYYASVKEAYYR